MGARRLPLSSLDRHMAMLIVKIEDDFKAVEIPEGRPVFIGRAKECDICLPSPAVSRRHAVVIFKNGICGVKDLNSFNGTQVDGERISRPVELKDRDSIGISTYKIKFILNTGSASGTEIRETVEAARRGATSVRMFASNLAVPRAMELNPAMSRLLDDASSVSYPPPETANEQSSSTDTVAYERPPSATKDDKTTTDAVDAGENRSPENEPGENRTKTQQAGKMASSVSSRFLADNLQDDSTDTDFTLFPSATPADAPPDETGAPSEPDRISSGSGTMPFPGALRRVMETRLALYALLDDLTEERKLFRLQSYVPTSAEAELIRQDGELDNLPGPEEADGQIKSLRALQTAQDEEIAIAESVGAEIQRPLDKALRSAEELAVSQWLLVRNSGRETFPDLIREAYAIVEDEPLARELTKAKISHHSLLGGAAYSLALEELQRETEKARETLNARARELNDGGDEGGMLGMLGKMASTLKNRGKNREESSRLAEEAKTLARRIVALSRESAYVQKLLFDEFWHLYPKVATHFLCRRSAIPLAVRAFLRYGAIGFQPWWMPASVREYVLDDCRDDVLARIPVSLDATRVVYADEFLAAIVHIECSPLPDESLLGAGKNTPEWKADRAFRRIVNSRSYTKLMHETLALLDKRIEDLGKRADGVEEKTTALESRGFASKEAIGDLELEHETLSARRTNLTRSATRLRDETLAAIQEAAKNYEQRFLSGELTLPSAKSLLKRECAVMAETSRRIAGKHLRCMPLALRDQFLPGDESVNDRPGVAAELGRYEEADPGLFVQSLVPARKKTNRIDMRMSPTVIVIPASGVKGLCMSPREGMEGGHMILPLQFSAEHIRRKQYTNMLADFRWETSKKLAGLDIMSSDTLAGAFSKMRWEWRNQPKEKREKALILNELSDAANWRKVYELLLVDSTEGCRRLFTRNPECYKAIVGTFFELPDGVAMLRPGAQA